MHIHPDRKLGAVFAKVLIYFLSLQKIDKKKKYFDCENEEMVIFLSLGTVNFKLKLPLFKNVQFYIKTYFSAPLKLLRNYICYLVNKLLKSAKKYNVTERVLNHLGNILRLLSDAYTKKESKVCVRINEIIPDIKLQ